MIPQVRRPEKLSSIRMSLKDTSLLANSKARARRILSGSSCILPCWSLKHLRSAVLSNRGNFLGHQLAENRGEIDGTAAGLSIVSSQPVAVLVIGLVEPEGEEIGWLHGSEDGRATVLRPPGWMNPPCRPPWREGRELASWSARIALSRPGFPQDILAGTLARAEFTTAKLRVRPALLRTFLPAMPA